LLGNYSKPFVSLLFLVKLNLTSPLYSRDRESRIYADDDRIIGCF
jgi:hypothetical protein